MNVFIIALISLERGQALGVREEPQRDSLSLPLPAYFLPLPAAPWLRITTINNHLFLFEIQDFMTQSEVIINKFLYLGQ